MTGHRLPCLHLNRHASGRIRAISKPADVEELTDSSRPTLSRSGSFNAPGTYYVLVKHAGSRSTPTSYMLSVQGDGVSVPAASRSADSDGCHDVVSRHYGALLLRCASIRARLDGDGRHAKSLGSRSCTTARAHRLRSISTLSRARLSTSVSGLEQARLYGLGEKIEPVDRGAANKFAQGDKSWSGNFARPGTYYVRIDHAGPGTSYCKLMVATVTM